MKELIEKIKKKYKIFIPIIVIIVLIIAIFYFHREYRYNNHKNKEEVMVYQYYGGFKTEYTSIITKNLKNIIVDIKAKNKKINYDATPVYYKEEDKVLFPNEMTIVFPIKEGGQYRLYKYSEYEFKNELHYINYGKNNKDYLYFFLYDGKNLFFFPDEVTLKINDKDYKKLSGMSYVQYITDTLIYYDKENDKSEVLDLENDNIIISNEYISLNIKEKYYERFSDKVLLFSPEYLNVLK